MIEFDNNIPVYIQILNFLKEKIVKRDLKEGDKMPSVRELAKELKVNPNTVQRAYKDLESSNIIFTKRGMGSFVTEDKLKINDLREDLAKEIILEFSTRMKNMGFNKEEMIEVINSFVEGD
ncbi:GntR family transcriptional regulator [Oceanirhabdus sp. W0125-5]|uniref:GntR family transcriptional regulator n=1 Tax=Oceanirhabdus sp. W0125-5 TaxID=2999116 RepID=UPI0022F2CCFB|nr:GntR family transcriptional regulator [Oceanirhabdus sp. W0125-5]WBW94887.1 GntR family transcriptional regulator [Oceanirhabdus sp. W0125-5]